MPSKIVADEGVGMNLPVYDFNAFLGHSRAILGQLRVRSVVVMDDMLLIIHHMRFSLRSKYYF